MQFSNSLGNLGLFKQAHPRRRPYSPPESEMYYHETYLGENEEFEVVGEIHHTVPYYEFGEADVGISPGSVDADTELHGVYDAAAWKLKKKVPFDFEAHGLDESDARDEIVQSFLENEAPAGPEELYEQSQEYNPGDF